MQELEVDGSHLLLISCFRDICYHPYPLTGGESSSAGALKSSDSGVVEMEMAIDQAAHG